MGTLITSFVFAGVISAYIFLGRGLARQVNAEGLESRTRLALYWLTQDVSSASAISTQYPGASTSGYQMTLTVTGLSSQVYYYCDWSLGSSQGVLERQVGSSGPLVKLLTNLTSFSFGYLDINGNKITAPSTGAPTTPPSTLQMDVKQVYMSYTSSAGVKSTGAQSNFTVVSPRIIMKNKGLLTDPNSP